MKKEELNPDAQKIKDFIIEVLQKRLEKEPIGLCLEYSAHHGDSSSTSHIIIKKDKKVIDVSDYDFEARYNTYLMEDLSLSNLLDFVQTENCGINNLNFLKQYAGLEPNIIPMVEKEILGKIIKKSKLYPVVKL